MDMKKFMGILFKTTSIVLTEVQEKIGDSNLTKNMLILSSCGSGKTEASYYISYIWGGKIKYAFPMKSLASSIRWRLNNYEMVLNTGDTWSIQHSGESEDPFLTSKKVVTTIDQILAGYIGIGRQAFIKGKNVVMSNFIFDEIQLFEPEKTLKTLIYMLDAIVKNSNKFTFMTATMPQVLMDFLAKRYDMETIITDRSSIQNRHVKLRYMQNINCKAIELFDKKQIIICNSQREQDEILSNIADKDRVILLNNKLLQTNRAKVETEVFKYFGKETPENNKILIATQIIEAGMDISATRMYSSLAPIDCLIQREGRVCRWGGYGELIIFEGFYTIYDKVVCSATLKKVKENDGIIFSWELQKKFVNEILNPFYEKHLKSLKRFRFDMESGDRDKLIRHIENINLIVSNTFIKNDFKRESVSISRNVLKKLSISNIFYVLRKGVIETVSEKDVTNGETVIIQGVDCIYDVVGFRYSEGSKACPFPMSKHSTKFIEYEDYIEEKWIEHSLEVKDVMKETLLRENFKPWSDQEIARYSTIAGLHDLGKITKSWYDYIGSTSEPLAHNVYAPRNNHPIRGIKHNYVSAIALRDGLNRLEFNIILNHHGRIMPSNSNINIGEYEFIDQYEDLINQVGYLEKVKKGNSNKDILDKNLMTPIDPEWVEFLYLEGSLMEADIEAIKRVKARKTP